MSQHTSRGRIGSWIVAVAALAASGMIGREAPLVAQSASWVPSVVVPLEPARILDTRLGIGAPMGALSPGQTITLQVTGAGNVPAGATGVVLNLTVNGASGAGYVSAYPAGATRPEASVLNYQAGADIANMVTATLSASGGLDLFNAQGAVHLIADVAGYLVPGGSGTPGPQGLQGPQGPQGPIGPAGPGAIAIDTAFPFNTTTALGTFPGFTLAAYCANLMASVSITPTSAGTMVVSGQMTTSGGGYQVVDILAGGSASQGTTTTSWMHLTALVDPPGPGLAHLDLRVQGPTCRAFGYVLPLSG